MTLTKALAALEAAGKIESRWLPGMLALDGPYPVRVLALPEALVYGVTEDTGGDVVSGYQPPPESAHSPDDPLTTMGLLLLLREATGDDFLVPTRTLRPFPAGRVPPGWGRTAHRSQSDIVCVRWHFVVAGQRISAPTERAAIEAAIVAVAEGASDV